MKNRKAKTEVSYSLAGNVASLDDFESPKKIGLPTK